MLFIILAFSLAFAQVDRTLLNTLESRTTLLTGEDYFSIGEDLNLPILDPTLNKHVFYARSLLMIDLGGGAMNGTSNWAGLQMPPYGDIGTGGVFDNRSSVYSTAQVWRNSSVVFNSGDVNDKQNVYLQHITNSRIASIPIQNNNVNIYWGSRSSNLATVAPGNNQYRIDTTLAGAVTANNTTIGTVANNSPNYLQNPAAYTNVYGEINRLPKFPKVDELQGIYEGGGIIGNNATYPAGHYSGMNITGGTTYLKAGTYYIDGDINLSGGAKIFINKDNDIGFQTVIYVSGNIYATSGTVNNVGANTTMEYIVNGTTAVQTLFGPENMGTTVDGNYLLSLTGTKEFEGNVVFIMTGNKKRALLGYNVGMVASIINPEGVVALNYGSTGAKGSSYTAQSVVYGQIMADVIVAGYMDYRASTFGEGGFKSLVYAAKANFGFNPESAVFYEDSLVTKGEKPWALGKRNQSDTVIRISVSEFDPPIKAGFELKIPIEIPLNSIVGIIPSSFSEREDADNEAIRLGYAAYIWGDINGSLFSEFGTSKTCFYSSAKITDTLKLDGDVVVNQKQSTPSVRLYIPDDDVYQTDRQFTITAKPIHYNVARTKILVQPKGAGTPYEISDIENKEAIITIVSDDPKYAFGEVVSYDLIESKVGEVAASFVVNDLIVSLPTSEATITFTAIHNGVDISYMFDAPVYNAVTEKSEIKTNVNFAHSLLELPRGLDYDQGDDKDFPITITASIIDGEKNKELPERNLLPYNDNPVEFTGNFDINYHKVRVSAGTSFTIDLDNLTPITDIDYPSNYNYYEIVGFRSYSEGGVVGAEITYLEDGNSIQAPLTFAGNTFTYTPPIMYSANAIQWFFVVVKDKASSEFAGGYDYGEILVNVLVEIETEQADKFPVRWNSEKDVPVISAFLDGSLIKENSTRKDILDLSDGYIIDEDNSYEFNGWRILSVVSQVAGVVVDIANEASKIIRYAFDGVVNTFEGFTDKVTIVVRGTPGEGGTSTPLDSIDITKEITIKITPINDNLVVPFNHEFEILQGESIEDFDLMMGATDGDLLRDEDDGLGNIHSVVKDTNSIDFKNLPATARKIDGNIFSYTNDGTPGIFTFYYQLSDGFQLMKDGEIDSISVLDSAKTGIVTIKVKADNNNSPIGTTTTESVAENGEIEAITLKISDGDLWKNSLTDGDIKLDEDEELTIEVTRDFEYGTATWSKKTISGNSFTKENSFENISLSYKHNDEDGTLEIFEDTLVYVVIDNASNESQPCTVFINIIPINDNLVVVRDTIFEILQGGIIGDETGFDLTKLWTDSDLPEEKNVYSVFDLQNYGISELKAKSEFGFSNNLTTNKFIYQNDGTPGIFSFTYKLIDGEEDYYYGSSLDSATKVAPTGIITIKVKADNNNFPTGSTPAVTTIDEDATTPAIIITITDDDLWKNSLTDEDIKLEEAEKLTIEITKDFSSGEATWSKTIISGNTFTEENSFENISLTYKHDGTQESPFVDTLKYKVVDNADNESEEYSVIININPKNDNYPAAQNDNVWIYVGSTLTFNPLIDDGSVLSPREATFSGQKLGKIATKADTDADEWLLAGRTPQQIADREGVFGELNLVESQTFTLYDLSDIPVINSNIIVTQNGNEISVEVKSGAIQDEFSGYIEYTITDKNTLQDGDAEKTATGKIYIVIMFNPDDLNFVPRNGGLNVDEGGKSAILITAAETNASKTELTNLLSRVPATNSGVKSDRVKITKIPASSTAELWGYKTSAPDDLVKLLVGDVIDGRFEYRHLGEENSTTTNLEFAFSALLPASFDDVESEVSATITPILNPRNDSKPIIGNKSASVSVKEKEEITFNVITTAKITDPDDWGTMTTKLRILPDTYTTDKGMEVVVTAGISTQEITYKYTEEIGNSPITDKIKVIVVDTTDGLETGICGINEVPVQGEHKIHPIEVEITINILPLNNFVPVAVGDDTIRVYINRFNTFNPMVSRGKNGSDIHTIADTDGDNDILYLKWLGTNPIEKLTRVDFGTKGGYAELINAVDDKITAIKVNAGTAVEDVDNDLLSFKDSSVFEIYYGIRDFAEYDDINPTRESENAAKIVIIVKETGVTPWSDNSNIMLNEGGRVSSLQEDRDITIGGYAPSSPDKSNLLYLVDEIAEYNIPADLIQIIALPENGELWGYIKDESGDIALTQTKLLVGDYIDGRFEYRHTKNLENPVRETTNMFTDEFVFVGLAEIIGEPARFVGSEGRVNITINPRNNHIPTISDKTDNTKLFEQAGWAEFVVFNNADTLSDFDINTTLKIKEITSVSVINNGIKLESMPNDEVEVRKKVGSDNTIEVKYNWEIGRSAKSENLPQIEILFAAIDETPYSDGTNDYESKGIDDVTGVDNILHSVSGKLSVRVNPVNNFAPIAKSDTIWTSFNALNIGVNVISNSSIGELNSHAELSGMPSSGDIAIRTYADTDLDGDGVILTGLNTQNNGGVDTTLENTSIMVKYDVINGIRVSVGNAFEFSGYYIDSVQYKISDEPDGTLYINRKDALGWLYIVVQNNKQPNLDTLYSKDLITNWTINEGALSDRLLLSGDSVGTGYKTLLTAIEERLSITAGNLNRLVIDLLPSQGELYGILVDENGAPIENEYVLLKKGDITNGDIRYLHTAKNETIWEDAFKFNVMLKKELNSLTSGNSATMKINILPRNNNESKLKKDSLVVNEKTLLPINVITSADTDSDFGTTLKIPVTSVIEGEPIVKSKNLGINGGEVTITGDSTISYIYSHEIIGVSEIIDTLLIQVIDTTDYSYYIDDVRTLEVDKTDNFGLNETGVKNFVSVKWDTIIVNIKKVFEFDLDEITIEPMVLNEGVSRSMSIISDIEEQLFGSVLGNFTGVQIQSIPTQPQGKLWGKRIVGGVVGEEPVELQSGYITNGYIEYRHNNGEMTKWTDEFSFTMVPKTDLHLTKESEESLKMPVKVAIVVNPRNDNVPTLAKSAVIEVAVKEQKNIDVITNADTDFDFGTTLKIPATTRVEGEPILKSKHNSGAVITRIGDSTISYIYPVDLFGIKEFNDTILVQVIDTTDYSYHLEDEKTLEVDKTDNFGLNETGAKNFVSVIWKAIPVKVIAKNNRIIIEPDSVGTNKPVVETGTNSSGHYAILKTHFVEENREVLTDGDIYLRILDYLKIDDESRQIIFDYENGGRVIYILDEDGDTLEFVVDNLNYSKFGNLQMLEKDGSYVYTHTAKGENFKDTALIVIREKGNSDRSNDLYIFIPISIIPMNDETMMTPELKYSVVEGDTATGNLIDTILSLNKNTNGSWKSNFDIYPLELEAGGSIELCDGSIIEKDTILINYIEIFVNTTKTDWTLDSTKNGIKYYKNQSGDKFEVNLDGSYKFINSGKLENVFVTISAKTTNPFNCTDVKFYNFDIVFIVSSANTAPVAVSDTIYVKQGEKRGFFGEDGSDNSYYQLKGKQPLSQRGKTHEYHDYDNDTDWKDLFVWFIDFNPENLADTRKYPMSGKLVQTDTLNGQSVPIKTELGIDGRPIDKEIHKYGGFIYEHDGGEYEEDMVWYVISDGGLEDTGKVFIKIAKKPSEPFDPKDTNGNDVRLPHYQDIDADGTIDRISIWFKNSIPVTADGLKPNRDSTDFAVRFMGKTIDIDSVVWQDNELHNNNKIWIYLNTSQMPENTTKGTMFTDIFYKNYPLKTADGRDSITTLKNVEVYDKAAPVIVSAKYYRNFLADADDKLVVKLSESANFGTENYPFHIHKSIHNEALAIGLTKIDSTETEITFLLHNEFKGQIARGDFININHQSGLSDKINNITQLNSLNIRRPIAVEMFNSIVSAEYFDTNAVSDGYIDLIKVYTDAGINDSAILSLLITEIELPAARKFTIEAIKPASYGFDIYVSQDKINPVNTAVDSSDVIVLKKTLQSKDKIISLIPTKAPINIIDSIAAVILDGELILGNKDTTLVVRYSEPVKIAGGYPYLFFDTDSNRVFNMEFSLQAPERIAADSYKYKVKRMDKSFPNSKDKISIVRANFVSDSLGNISNSTIWAPLNVKDSTDLGVDVFDWLKVYPSPVWLSRNNGNLEPNELNRDMADYYGIKDLLEISGNPKGVAFILESANKLSGDLKLHSGKVKVFDYTGNAVTDELKMKFTSLERKSGSIAGVAFWDCKNKNGRIVGPQTYIAVIELKIVLEKDGVQTSITRTYRKNVNIGIQGATK